jgi:hypothetical protein
MRRQRKYLCIGCKFAPKKFTEDIRQVACGLLGGDVEPVPHSVGMKFEDCPHRIRVQIQANLESCGERLARLAKIARELGTSKVGDLAQYDQVARG